LYTKLRGNIENTITENNKVVNKPELDLTTAHTGFNGERTVLTAELIFLYYILYFIFELIVN